MNLLEVMPAIRAQVPNAHLLVVGEFYDDPRPYRETVRHLGIESAVTFIDEYVANETVHRYFMAANLVVLPYREATQSGILSIAYGFARPVVVTDVGGLAELVEDGKTGFIVPPHDPQKLIGAIVRYFAERHEESFSRNIEMKRKENSFANIQNVFETIYNDLQRA
jgi:glycosyltransferase involved in cell wall biosynthesis